MATRPTLVKKPVEPVVTNEDVNPKIAERWLDTNHDNRSISNRRVEQYAKVMRDGGWHLNGETIKFDTSGNLIDGQHRLWAVMQSAITVRMSVARNVAPEANKTIDRGRPRSIAEAFRREGTIPEPKRVAMWTSATYVLLVNSTKQNSVEETEQYYKDNKDHVDAMLAILPEKGAFKLAIVGAALVYARPKHPVQIDQFARQLVSGVDLTLDSPVYVLRELLITSVGKRSSGSLSRQYGIKVLRAVQAHLRGQTIDARKLYATESALPYFRTKDR